MMLRSNILLIASMMLSCSNKHVLERAKNAEHNAEYAAALSECYDAAVKDWQTKSLSDAEVQAKFEGCAKDADVKFGRK